MENILQHKKQIEELGYTIIENVFSNTEVQNIIDTINNTDTSKDTFRKSKEVFAIRQFLKEIPEMQKLIFNTTLLHLIKHLFGEKYFVVKSIYFDKPETSNWYVAYHQDLTISVDARLDIPHFGPWTVKQNQFAVQPPIEILENIYTVRIHLDDTNENNGALKVVEKSHLSKIVRTETIGWQTVKETPCKVPKGGIMIMKPLILHSSQRTTNNQRRRVIHIEFSDMELPQSLNWAEKSVTQIKH